MATTLRGYVTLCARLLHVDERLGMRQLLLLVREFVFWFILCFEM